LDPRPTAEPDKRPIPGFQAENVTNARLRKILKDNMLASKELVRISELVFSSRTQKKIDREGLR
jgi:hypothetical protein